MFIRTLSFPSSSVAECSKPDHSLRVTWPLFETTVLYCWSMSMFTVVFHHCFDWQTRCFAVASYNLICRSYRLLFTVIKYAVVAFLRISQRRRIVFCITEPAGLNVEFAVIYSHDIIQITWLFNVLLHFSYFQIHFDKPVADLINWHHKQPPCHNNHSIRIQNGSARMRVLSGDNQQFPAVNQ